jgi:hypothetical protein
MTRVPFGIVRDSMFTCIICGLRSGSSLPGREGMACFRCGATWRARAMVLGVLQSLGYLNTTLSDVGEDLSIRGLGTSDDEKFAIKLANKFDYVNTFYHKGPVLDLTNIEPRWRECAHFVTCSDVLEHIPPPTNIALEGLYSLVAPGGAAIVSIPYTTADTSIEFYPNLDRYEIQDNQVVWHDTMGQRHVDTNPEFHGGAGQTLSFRAWSLSRFEEALLSAGFSRVERVILNASLGVPPIPFCDAILIARK